MHTPLWCWLTLVWLLAQVDFDLARSNPQEGNRISSTYMLLTPLAHTHLPAQVLLQLLPV